MGKNGNSQAGDQGQGRGPLRPSPLLAGRLITWVLLLLLAGLALWRLGGAGEGGTPIPYSRFWQELQGGNVARLTLSGQRIAGELKETTAVKGPQGEVIEADRFVTHLPAFGDERLLSQLEAQGVEIEVEPAQEFPWGIVILSLAPFLLLLVLGAVALRRMQAQGRSAFGLGRSPARRYQHQREEVTFDDVAGNDNTKRELQEIIEFLQHPARFRSLGGQIPRGVLLKGPPGTGKTLMARAVAGEAGVPFFSITGSDFMEMLVGVGAARVRHMFRDAKKMAPSIIFIDELDSIGRRRGTGLGGGHDEREQTLNQLLSEMDGFEPSENIIVMAATNRPDILDPALLRPGRFDRTISTELPPKQARLAILRIHARSKPLADEVDLDEVAKATPGFSGADLKNLLNEAALLAARKDKERIGAGDIEAARDKVMMGLKKENLSLSEEELRTLAYHEGGHALLAAVLPHADLLHKVTIIPRGKAMGVTQQLPEKEKYLYSRSYLIDRLTVMMGGRAAEELVLGTTTSGAENDLKQATRLARKMVLDWGMSEELPHLALGGRREQVFLGEEIAQRRDYSEATAKEIDEEINRILQRSYRQALETLEKHRQGLDRLAQTLLEEEEIGGDRVFELLGVERQPAAQA